MIRGCVLVWWWWWWLLLPLLALVLILPEGTGAAFHAKTVPLRRIVRYRINVLVALRPMRRRRDGPLLNVHREIHDGANNNNNNDDENGDDTSRREIDPMLQSRPSEMVGLGPVSAAAATDEQGDTSSISTTPTSSSSSTRSLLISNDEIQQQMKQLQSKYPTSESAYLAAARARSAAKIASQERAASDQDWVNLSNEKKKQLGLNSNSNNDDDDVDGWESSRSNIIDSQILIPLPPDSDDDGPKLLLF